MGKASFILYDDDFKYAERLSDSQKAKLFTALLRYRFHGEYTNFDDDLPLFILYNHVIDHVAENEAKYKETCEKKADAAKRRWNTEKKSMQKDNTLCTSIKEDAYAYDNDNDNDNDNDYDYVNVNDTVACGAKRENKRKNNYNKNIPALLRDEPNYDIEAFTRKALNLKYVKLPQENT